MSERTVVVRHQHTNILKERSLDLPRPRLEPFQIAVIRLLMPHGAMKMSSTSSRSNIQKDHYHLAFHAILPDSDGVDGACTSFNASLENRRAGGVGLSGVSGILIDMDKAGAKSICVTIHDGVKRHTPPKRLTLTSDSEAQADLDGGTDGRLQVSTRWVVYLWLPEIFDESDGVGSMLLASLLTFLKIRDASILIDFGVGHEEKEEGEENGFVEIFYPDLDELDLELSDCGRFATGSWPSGSDRRRRSRVVGFVHL